MTAKDPKQRLEEAKAARDEAEAELSRADHKYQLSLDELDAAQRAVDYPNT